MMTLAVLMLVMMTPRLGRGVPGVVRRAAGDTVAVVGGVAGQCDNHEGEGDKGGREELQEGHGWKYAAGAAQHPREIALITPQIRHP